MECILATPEQSIPLETLDENQIGEIEDDGMATDVDDGTGAEEIMPDAQSLLKDATGLFVAYKSINGKEHDPDAFKQIYLKINKWQKGFPLIPESHQEKLAQHAGKIEQVRLAIARTLRQDQALNKEIDAIVDALDQSDNDPDRSTARGIVRQIGTAKKLAKALNDSEVQLVELETMLKLPI